MTGAPRSLDTRWSLLEDLRGPRAEEAWSWFSDRYRPYVRSVLQRTLRAPDRTDAALDEVWSHLFTSEVIENADRGRRFRSYLAGTVRHFALGWLRRHPAVDEAEPDDAPAAHGDPAEQLEAEELRLWKRQVVQLALDQLANRHEQQVQVLRLFYGLPAGVDTAPGEPRSAAWIATHLGIQANAVHQLVFRGRKRLRSCIENELRETVGDAEALADELRLVYEVIERENPGLEG
jgi:RNA polymerase sigma factor (sigma-70 family)